jgi:hypothetical protein
VPSEWGRGTEQGGGGRQIKKVMIIMQPKPWYNEILGRELFVKVKE